MSKYKLDLFLANLTNLNEIKEVGSKNRIADILEIVTSGELITEDLLKNIRLEDIHEARRVVNLYNPEKASKEYDLLQEMIDVQLSKDNLKNVKNMQTTNSVDFF